MTANRHEYPGQTPTGSDQAPWTGADVTPVCDTCGPGSKVLIPVANEVSSMQHHVYWNQNYVASEYAFDTTRKSGEIAASSKAVTSLPRWWTPFHSPSGPPNSSGPCTKPEYVDAVVDGRPSSLAESQGFDWDPMIPTMAIAHSSGLVAAVTEVMGGSPCCSTLPSEVAETGWLGLCLRGCTMPGPTRGTGTARSTGWSLPQSCIRIRGRTGAGSRP